MDDLTRLRAELNAGVDVDQAAAEMALRAASIEHERLIQGEWYALLGDDRELGAFVYRSAPGARWTLQLGDPRLG